MTQDVHRACDDHGKYNYQWYQRGKIIPNFLEANHRFWPAALQSESRDETDKCRYCAAEDNRVECYPFAYSSGSDDFNYNEFVIIRQTMQLDALNIISSCRALALTFLLADGQFQRRYNSVVCSKMEPTTGRKGIYHKSRCSTLEASWFCRPTTLRKACQTLFAKFSYFSKDRSNLKFVTSYPGSTGSSSGLEDICSQ